MAGMPVLVPMQAVASVPLVMPLVGLLLLVLLFTKCDLLFLCNKVTLLIYSRFAISFIIMPNIGLRYPDLPIIFVHILSLSQ